MLRVGGMAALAAVLVTPALAADYIPRRAPYAAPMASPAYNWSGFYGGINAGWAGSHANAGITLGGTSFDVTQSLDGMIGGVQLGYNWQYNYLLVGLEADIQASSQQND